MKIESIVIREIHMRMKAPFETSFGTVQNRRIVLVEVVADGVSGWGEVTAGEAPGYNAETTDTAWHILTDFIGPSIHEDRSAEGNPQELRRESCEAGAERHSQ